MLDFIFSLVLQGYISNTCRPGFIGVRLNSYSYGIIEVYHGTPAERAGLIAKDQITFVEGGRIEGEPGSVVELTIKRGQEFFKVKVTRAPIDELPPVYRDKS